MHCGPIVADRPKRMPQHLYDVVFVCWCAFVTPSISHAAKRLAAKAMPFGRPTDRAGLSGPRLWRSPLRDSAKFGRN